MCMCVCSHTAGTEARRWKKKCDPIVSNTLDYVFSIHSLEIFDILSESQPPLNTAHTHTHNDILCGLNVCNMIHNSDCVRLDLTGFIICFLVIFFPFSFSVPLRLLVVFYLSVIKQKAKCALLTHGCAKIKTNIQTHRTLILFISFFLSLESDSVFFNLVSLSFALNQK